MLFGVCAGIIFGVYAGTILEVFCLCHGHQIVNENWEVIEYLAMSSFFVFVNEIFGLTNRFGVFGSPFFWWVAPKQGRYRHFHVLFETGERVSLRSGHEITGSIELLVQIHEPSLWLLRFESGRQRYNLQQLRECLWEELSMDESIRTS